MPKPIPQPRLYDDVMTAVMAVINPDGTWLEPEEFCYPSGGQLRRARVRCPDGKLRVVRCGIPDSFFGIPGRVSYGGRNYVGYVTGKESADGAQTLEFVPTSTKPIKRGGGKPVVVHPAGSLLADVCAATVT